MRPAIAGRGVRPGPADALPPREGARHADAAEVRLRSPVSQQGFSLVEVLVSMMMLGMLSVSVFYFLNSQNSMGTRSGDMLKGLNLGKLAMDSLKVSDYDDLEAGSDTVVDRYIRSWRITMGTGEDGQPSGRKIIDVTVHWPLTAVNHLTFTSILSDGRFKEER